MIVRWYAEKLRPTTGAHHPGREQGRRDRLFWRPSLPHAQTGRHTRSSCTAGVRSPRPHYLYQESDASMSPKALKIAATIEQTADDGRGRCQVAGQDRCAELTALSESKKEQGHLRNVKRARHRSMGAIYKEHEKLEAVEVIYRTAGDALNDLASGALDYGVFDNIFAASQERAGRIRILGISTGQRMQATPQLPTMTEQGVPMDVTGGFGMIVPSGNPAARRRHDQPHIQSGDRERGRQEILQQHRQRSLGQYGRRVRSIPARRDQEMGRLGAHRQAPAPRLTRLETQRLPKRDPRHRRAKRRRLTTADARR